MQSSLYCSRVLTYVIHITFWLLSKSHSYPIPLLVYSFCKQCSSFYENKILQQMSAGASLERLCESTLLTIPPCLYPILLLSLILCMFLVHSGKCCHQRVGNTVYSRKTKSSRICSNLWCWSNIWSINVALRWVISIWWGFKKYLYWVQNGPK